MRRTHPLIQHCLHNNPLRIEDICKYSQRSQVNDNTMSKLSSSLKALINSPVARPGPIPAPRNIKAIYRKIQQGAIAHNVSQPSWLALSTAATMTMNSPESLTQLFHLVTQSSQSFDSNDDRSVTTSRETADAEAIITTAEFMREVGLKCISFNGIPRTINSLNAFRANLPLHISKKLSRTPTREPTLPENTSEKVCSRGFALWTSVYRPLERKLYKKLADAHPDLPVVIVNYHYGALLGDPPQHTSGELKKELEKGTGSTSRVGRLSTSIVAIACLRAQSGVGPQVTSHVFGLKKALDDGSWIDDAVESEQGARWLASDEGLMWMLNSVDEIVHAIGGGMGSSFAPMRAKL